MNEIYEPLPVMDGFVDSSEFSARLAELHRSRRLRAVSQLAIVSQLRAQAHAAANLFRDFHVGEREAGTAGLRAELADAQSASARWDLMQAHGEFRTVDLARVENRGDWDATAEVETELAAIASALRAAGNGGDAIDRHSPDAKRRIAVDPGLLSANGLVVVRRKRLMMVTAPQEVLFQDLRRKGGEVMVADSRIEVDKVSEFVLDLRVLRRMHAAAADEVEEAVRSGSPAELTNHGRDLVSPRIIEAAIDVRHEVLTPGVTTYYADRKYSNVQAIDDAPQAELEPVGQA